MLARPAIAGSMKDIVALVNNDMARPIKLYW